MILTVIIDYTSKPGTFIGCFSSSYGYKIYLNDDIITTNIDYMANANLPYKDEFLYEAAIKCIKKIKSIVKEIPEITKINFVCKNYNLKNIFNNSTNWSDKRRLRLKAREINNELGFLPKIYSSININLYFSVNNKYYNLAKKFYKELRNSIKTQTTIKDILFEKEI